MGGNIIDHIRDENNYMNILCQHSPAVLKQTLRL